MKIALSTKDGLIMGSSFENSNGFLVITEAFSEIIDEELRLLPATTSSNINELISLIPDCEQLIVRHICKSARQQLEEKGKAVILTSEDIITNVIFHYLDQNIREAADTCCCP